MNHFILFLILSIQLSTSKMYTIELVNGHKFNVQYLLKEEVQSILENNTWEKKKTTSGVDYYKNEDGLILDVYANGIGILFEKEADFSYCDIPCKVVILQSMDLSRLIYFQLLEKEELKSILSKYKYKKNHSLSMKKHYDILLLDNGKVVLQDVSNTFGEIYNSVDEYIEIRKIEGDPFIGVAVPSIKK